jgi:hypothetical protein
VDEQSLLEHIPKHKESKHLKTHICEYCGKSYTQETYLAKHMAKHADRMEKRGLLVRSAVVSAAAAAAAAAANSQQTPDPYAWNKGNADICNNNNNSTSNNNNNGTNGDLSHHHQQNSSNNNNNNDPNMALQLTSDGRYTTSGGNNSNNNNNSNSNANNTNGSNRSHEEMMYASSQDMSQKSAVAAAAAAAAAASAFTPIQPMSIQSAAGGGRSVYFPYESFGFPSKSSNGSSGVGMDVVKNVTGHTAFPNQLIALHQIRNYASMPGSLSVGGMNGSTGGDSKQEVKQSSQ